MQGTILPEYAEHIVLEKFDNLTELIRVKIQKPFDWAKIKELPFTLEVSDADPAGSEPSNTASVEIVLIITDKNNKDPVIVSPVNYNASDPAARVYEVMETDMRNKRPEEFAGFQVLQVEATDEDSELYLPFEFLPPVVPPELEGFLSVDRETGWLSVDKPLDREAPGMAKLHIVQLRVRDNRNQSFDQRISNVVNVCSDGRENIQTVW